MIVPATNEAKGLGVVANNAFPLPEREQERLYELEALNIMDSLPELAYDGCARLAATICGTPIALITLLDGSRQWFKAKFGLQVAETPRDQAFCAHTIMDPGSLMVVNDAMADERFLSNPLVTGDPNIRFYAGVPLVTASGLALGSLCVIDREPRELDPRQREALEILASQVSTMLQLRRSLAQLENMVLEQDAEMHRWEEYRRELERAESELKEAAFTDPVSGLANRRALDIRLAEEVSRALRYKAPMSLVMIDIDHFKEHNDTLGHVAGDEALRHVGKVLASGLRPNDFLGRYGGDEFMVILPNTKARGAAVYAERLRREVAAAGWQGREVTVSVGYSVMGRAVKSGEELFARADQALYLAKQSGRNCVHGPRATAP